MTARLKAHPCGYSIHDSRNEKKVAQLQRLGKGKWQLEFTSGRKCIVPTVKQALTVVNANLR